MSSEYQAENVIEQQGPDEFVVWAGRGEAQRFAARFDTIEEARDAYPGSEEDSSWDPESDGGPSDAECRRAERRGFDF